MTSARSCSGVRGRALALAVGDVAADGGLAPEGDAAGLVVGVAVAVALALALFAGLADAARGTSPYSPEPESEQPASSKPPTRTAATPADRTTAGTLTAPWTAHNPPMRTCGNGWG